MTTAPGAEIGPANQSHVLGVLGGMGPLASAEFLKTIYEQSLGEREQAAPAVIVYSDPAFPDRTEVFLNGDSGLLLDHLVSALWRLSELGATTIVICCVTAHHLLPEVPDELRGRIISLVELALAEVVAARTRQLLLCSNGTRRLEIFQRHDLWARAQDYIVLPEAEAQEDVHELIYRIKRNRHQRSWVPSLERLLSQHQVSSFIAGCTELHLLAKQMGASPSGPARAIDPLDLVAKSLARGAAAEPPRRFS